MTIAYTLQTHPIEADRSCMCFALNHEADLCSLALPGEADPARYRPQLLLSWGTLLMIAVS